MKKPTEEQYKAAVKKAIKLLKHSNKIKQEITALSFKVCVDTHGGASAVNLYNVKRFAKDIGMPEKRLYRWRREYKQVFHKIGITDVNSVSRKTLDATLKDVNPKTPPEEVRRVYDKYDAKFKDPDNQFLADCMKRSSAIKFTVCHSLILEKCDQEDLKIIGEHLRQAVAAIDNHFAGIKPVMPDVSREIARGAQLVGLTV